MHGPLTGSFKPVQDQQESLSILVATVSATDRLLLKKLLTNQGHRVSSACDGEQAIAVYQLHRPDLVLLDVLMPKLDGFDVASRIKDMAGEEFVPILFLTSLTEADSLARCLDAGGDDVLGKPYRGTILKAKINAFHRMRQMHRTLQHQRDQIVEHNRHLLQEQEIAKRVYDKVAHAGCLDASNIKYMLSPLSVFNGDVALATVNPAGNLTVLLGDFTGHGLAAAIGAMPTAQTFYSMLEKGFSMRDVVGEINRKLHEILPVGVFCCAIIIECDFAKGQLQVWNGGVPDCAIYRPSTDATISLHSRHLPLGILEPERFNDATEVFKILVGDRAYLWTDGIHEAQNSDGDMFGAARLQQIMKDNTVPEQLFSEIITAVNEFVAGEILDDDISLIEVLTVPPNDFTVELPEPSEQPVSLGHRDWHMRYLLHPDELRDFNPLPLLLHILMQVPELRIHGSNIYTVLAELYSNALEHGVLNLTSAMKSSPQGFEQYYQLREQRLAELHDGFVSFDIRYCSRGGGEQLEIVVEDSGEGFDYRHLPTNGTPNVGYAGRGISILLGVCDSVEYRGKGNIVKVIISH